MSRDDRDDLRDRLDDISDTLRDDEIKFTSEVVIITDDMVDDNGNTIESKLPDPTGKELEVPSDVVTVTRDDVDAD
jgi:hypothetical protein